MFDLTEHEQKAKDFINNYQLNGGAKSNDISTLQETFKIQSAEVMRFTLCTSFASQ